MVSFNPRTRVGCDPQDVICPTTGALVSIHAPAWGATLYPCVESWDAHPVSIHAPAWGATRTSGLKPDDGRLFQSTHPRGVRHLVFCFGDYMLHGVSIHAPAWGATTAPERQDPCYRVSIHAPAWGATHAAGALPQSLVRFNPRTRVGCDSVPGSIDSTDPVFQSTHPRGVRLKFIKRGFSLIGFQSTHPRGVRRTASDGTSISAMFQSTHPRGVRRASPSPEAS